MSCLNTFIFKFKGPVHELGHLESNWAKGCGGPRGGSWPIFCATTRPLPLALVPCLLAALLLLPLLPCADGASPVRSIPSVGLSSCCCPDCLLGAGGGEKKPSGVIRASSHHSHPPTVLSNWDWCLVPAVSG